MDDVITGPAVRDPNACLMTEHGDHSPGVAPCVRPAEWVLVGPMYAPAQWLLDQGVDPDAPVGNQGFICETRSCTHHLDEARDWFFDPDVHTVSEARDLVAAAGSLAQAYGCRVVQVQSSPAA